MADDVELVPMDPATWAAWRETAIARYAADMIRTGAWPAHSADRRATDLFARLVPDGMSTAGHEFRSIVTDRGDVAGAVWFAAEDAPGRGTAFLWDLFIDPPFRGRGLGRATMEALDGLARSLGYDALRLHVFGDNEIARNLYRSVGYVETDVTMLKPLVGEPGALEEHRS